MSKELSRKTTIISVIILLICGFVVATMAVATHGFRDFNLNAKIEYVDRVEYVDKIVEVEKKGILAVPDDFDIITTNKLVIKNYDYATISKAIVNASGVKTLLISSANHSFVKMGVYRHTLQSQDIYLTYVEGKGITFSYYPYKNSNDISCCKYIFTGLNTKYFPNPTAIVLSADLEIDSTDANFNLFCQIFDFYKI